MLQNVRLNTIVVSWSEGGPGIHRIYPDADDGDLYFCPGERVHYEFLLRDGFRDVLAWNPGDANKDVALWARNCAVLSGARIARPIRSDCI